MKKIASRTAQFPLFADFTFAFNDWAVDSVDGTKKTFGSLVANSVDPLEAGLQAGTGIVLDVIPMPVGAVITGGEVIVDQAYAGIGAGATLNLGVAGDTACYLAALDLDAALVNARTPLLLTKVLASNNGQNMRMTIAGMSAAATAGKVRVRVQYTIDGRVSENQIA